MMISNDRHAAAFHGAGPDDWTSDEDIAVMLHEGELVYSGTGLAGPDAYDGWDDGRHPDGPKTHAEAVAALHERVLDPAAPDTDPHAYDDHEGTP